MNKKSLTLATVIALSIVALVALKTRGSTSSTDQDVYQRVTQSDNHNHVRVSGRLQAAKSTLITIPEDGVIVDIITPFGGVVETGDPLISLKSNDMKNKYLDTLIEYLTKQNDTREALKEYQSQKKLFQSGLTPENELIQAEKDYFLKEIETIKSQTNLEQFVESFDTSWDEIDQLRLSDVESFKLFMEKQSGILKIKSTTSGTFAAYKYKDAATQDTVSVQSGAFIAKNKIIGSVSDLSQLKAVANISEKDIHHLHIGMSVNLSLSHDRSKQFKGTIEAIDLSEQLDNHGSAPTYPVTIQPENKEFSPEYLGKKVVIELVTAKQTYLLVPISAILVNDYGHAVLVGPDRTVTEVEIGPTFGQSVAILSGLNENDEVIINPSLDDHESFIQETNPSTLISL
ncbi:MAG: hypothetical protein CMF46_02115 [Legionellales bacterium]|nr:hypothetical protein [Legionellales bacterium]|tara:strand:+ start:1431 stop:2633 length:1203 start_codon:yes stop_codon:yes gene_type:complete